MLTGGTVHVDVYSACCDVLCPFVSTVPRVSAVPTLSTVPRVSAVPNVSIVSTSEAGAAFRHFVS